MFDALLERVNRDLGRHGSHFTPSSVVKCMIDVLNPRSTDTVYDPSCGSGELLVTAAQHGRGVGVRPGDERTPAPDDAAQPVDARQGG